MATILVTNRLIYDLWTKCKMKLCTILKVAIPSYKYITTKIGHKTIWYQPHICNFIYSIKLHICHEVLFGTAQRYQKGLYQIFKGSRGRMHCECRGKLNIELLSLHHLYIICMKGYPAKNLKLQVTHTCF